MARLTDELHLQSCMYSERIMYTWGHNDCVLWTNIDTYTPAHVRPPPARFLLGNKFLVFLSTQALAA